MPLAKTISSGKPSGRTSASQTRKRGFRVKRISVLLTADTTYGPVPGNAPWIGAFIGTPSGTGKDDGTASLYTKSGSGFASSNVTVLAVPSVMIAAERSQRLTAAPCRLAQPSAPD